MNKEFAARCFNNEQQYTPPSNKKNKDFHPRLPQPNVSTFIEHILDMLNFKLSFS